MAVDPITLNFANGYYLKIGVALQATVDAAEEPEPSKALDIIIATLSNQAVEGLKSAEGRNQANETLRKKIVEAYDGEVMDVYLTEFVFQ